MLFQIKALIRKMPKLKWNGQLKCWIRKKSFHLFKSNGVGLTRSTTECFGSCVSNLQASCGPAQPNLSCSCSLSYFIMVAALPCWEAQPSPGACTHHSATTKHRCAIEILWAETKACGRHSAVLTQDIANNYVHFDTLPEIKEACKQVALANKLCRGLQIPLHLMSVLTS